MNGSRCFTTGQLGGGDRAGSYNSDRHCPAAARKARGQDERLPFMAGAPRRISGRNHSPGEAEKNAWHAESTTEVNLREILVARRTQAIHKRTGSTASTLAMSTKELVPKTRLITKENGTMALAFDSSQER